MRCGSSPSDSGCSPNIRPLAPCTADCATRCFSRSQSIAAAESCDGSGGGVAVGAAAAGRRIGSGRSCGRFAAGRRSMAALVAAGNRIMAIDSSTTARSRDSMSCLWVSSRNTQAWPPATRTNTTSRLTEDRFARITRKTGSFRIRRRASRSVPLRPSVWTTNDRACVVQGTAPSAPGVRAAPLRGPAGPPHH
jgi:hypothetical protein